MLVLDTNVLLYAADQDSEHHAGCRRLVDRLRRTRSPVFVTWGICYEFLRVATHPRVFARPWTAGGAWRFIEALLAGPAVTVLLPTPRHRAVLEETLEDLPQVRGNLVHDLHTAVLMREHGVSRICTRDADFHRFPFLTVVDPADAAA